MSRQRKRNPPNPNPVIEQVTEEEIKSGPEEPTAGENTEILESEDTLEAAEPAENVEASTIFAASFIRYLFPI